MRYFRPLSTLVFAVTGVFGLVGCHHRCHTLLNNVVRTIKTEPKCFDYCDRSPVFQRIACEYWSKNMCGTENSAHFKSGFLEGFADYLHRGGTGAPPAIPPRRFWEPSLSTCRQDAARDWKSGFREGAQIARESGMRELIVVPYDGPSLSGCEQDYLLSDTSEMPSEAMTAAEFYGTHGVESAPFDSPPKVSAPAEYAAANARPAQTTASAAHEVTLKPVTFKGARKGITMNTAAIPLESTYVDQDR